MKVTENDVVKEWWTELDNIKQRTLATTGKQKRRKNNWRIWLSEKQQQQDNTQKPGWNNNTKTQTAKITPPPKSLLL